VLVCLGSGLLAPAGHCGQDPETTAAELERLRQRIDALQSELQSNQQKKTRAERQLQDAEQLISAAHRALRKTDLELNALGQQLAALKADQQTTTATLHRQSSELAREARTAYAMGRQQQIKLLLNQEQPAAVGRMLVYFAYFSRARQAKIAAIHSSLQHLETVKKDIQTKSQSLTDVQEEQRQQAARLEVQRQKREQVLAQLITQLHSQGGEL
jgi:septal ring factor EnvC (AmiA/AmiB activator)